MNLSENIDQKFQSTKEGFLTYTNGFNQGEIFISLNRKTKSKRFHPRLTMMSETKSNFLFNWGHEISRYNQRNLNGLPRSKSESSALYMISTAPYFSSEENVDKNTEKSHTDFTDEALTVHKPKAASLPRKLSSKLTNFELDEPGDRRRINAEITQKSLGTVS